jgi:hypothetical protein
VTAAAAGSAWCRCGRPIRGQVDDDGQAPSHFCRQCSPEHCEMAAYLRRRVGAFPDSARDSGTGLSEPFREAPRL